MLDARRWVGSYFEQTAFLLVILIIISSLSFWVMISYSQYNEVENNIVKNITDGWQYHAGDIDITNSNDDVWTSNGAADTRSKGNSDNVMWVRGIMPDYSLEEPAIFFRTSQQVLEIYIDNNIIYSFGKFNPTEDFFAPGASWHFVNLPQNYSKKPIYIRTYSPFSDRVGFVSEISMGTKSEIILLKLSKNISSLLLAIFYVCIGLTMLTLFIVIRKRHTAFLSICIASLSIGLWVAAESRVIQLLVNNPSVNMYLAFLGIFLMPIGFCSFVEKAFDIRFKKVINLLWKIYLIFTPVAFLLEFLHVVSIFYTVKVFHALLVITMIIVMGSVVEAAVKGDIELRVFSLAMLLLSITGLYDIVSMFYSSKYIEQDIKLTAWGMLPVVLSLTFIIGKRYVDMYDTLEAYSKQNETNFHSLFENMIDGFVYSRIIVSEAGKPIGFIPVEINDQLCFQLKVSREQLLGNDIKDVVPALFDSDFNWSDSIERVYATNEKVKISGYFDKLKCWFDISIFSPQEGHLCVIFTDITERKEAEAELKRSERHYRYQAFTDTVTGLYNRTYFEEEMQRHWKDIFRAMPLSIISIDMDGLKIVNDTFGHKAGDELLKAAADILSRVFRKADILARVGGDEFSVILPKTDNVTAQLKRDRIVEAMKEYNREGKSIKISMSIGVATYDETVDSDIYSTYKRADDRMYQYKLSQAGSLKSKVIDMLLTALSERDYVADGHIERLIKMSELMSEGLKLSETERRNLILLAKMHDLGKIGIPDEILFKPDKLTDEEYNCMKQHVSIGFDIANRSKELSGIAKLILYHHERWDGKGYPGNLRGELIPIECRILSIIDSYDSMTSRRKYSDAISEGDALLELKRCSGTQFDPILTEKFIYLIRRKCGLL